MVSKFQETFLDSELKQTCPTPIPLENQVGWPLYKTAFTSWHYPLFNRGEHLRKSIIPVVMAGVLGILDNKNTYS